MCIKFTNEKKEVLNTQNKDSKTALPWCDGHKPILKSKKRDPS